MAKKFEAAHGNLLKWLELGGGLSASEQKILDPRTLPGKMTVTDMLGYQELTTFKFVKDLLKRGTFLHRWKAKVKQSGMMELAAPNVSYALMTSSADSTPYNFIKLSLSGEGPKTELCKLDFGFRVDKCTEGQGCCCPAGIVKSDTALNDPNPEDSSCTDCFFRAQSVASAFANKWTESHPEVMKMVEKCTRAVKDGQCDEYPPPVPYCDALDGKMAMGGGNSELDLDGAVEMENFRV